jgi:hypothetical protein
MTPWYSGDEIAEIADALAVDRAAELATAIEIDVEALPSYQPGAAYVSPTSEEGGVGWIEAIALAIGAVLVRGVPSKGPVRMIARMFEKPKLPTA